MFKVGKVLNFYDKLGTAIVELDGNLAVGERVRFVKDGALLFEQTITSIQIEHEKRNDARRGDVVALKTHEAVKTGTEIFKIG